MKQKYFLRGLSIGLLCAIVLFVVSSVIRSQENGDNPQPQESQTPTASEAVVTDGPQMSAAPEGTTTPDVTVLPGTTASVQVTQNPNSDVQATQVPGVSVTVTPNQNPGTNGDGSQQVPQPKTKSIEVKAGMSSADVSAKLKELGLIDSAEDFNTYLNNRGQASSIKVGKHEVPTNATYEQVANAICDYKK